MIRKPVRVLGQDFEIRLPETYREFKKLAVDDYSRTRLLQIAVHQRQLQHIAALIKAGHSPEDIQGWMNTYRYRAHDVGGAVER